MVNLVWGERYESQEMVGSTQKGQLHLGWDRSLHRPVALAVFPGMPDEDRENLLRDIRAAAGGSWPSRPDIYDVGLDAGTVYVVYGRVAGQPFWRAWKSGSGSTETWLSRLTQLGEAALEWYRAGLQGVSLDPRWIWLRPEGGVVFYGLGAGNHSLPRELAHTAVRLATGNPDAPLQWEVLEKSLTGQIPPLWIQAFGHWWLRAVSQDPTLQFSDLETCVRGIRDVFREAPPELIDASSSAAVSAPAPSPKKTGVGEASNRPVGKGIRPSGGAPNPWAQVRAMAFGRGKPFSTKKGKGWGDSRMADAVRAVPRPGVAGWMHRFHWSRAAMVLMVAILAVVGGASLAYAVFMRGPGDATMPFVVGKSYDDALGALVQAGLDPSKVVKEPQASTQPPGTVIGQDPYAGKTVKPDRVVHLQVAAPPNSPGSGAAGPAFGPEPGNSTQGSGSSTSGSTGTTTPGGSASPGATPAPGVKTVPDLTGLTLDQAQSQLLSLGIHYRYEIVSSDRPKGTVIDQTPSPGTQVGDGDYVVFRVSRGS
ncbi:PASTA domain-containing protein [Kyrpidia tusciae]|uniref:PASTA domain containing protein n=1 Tax=Kyrpidia tusciae (strain DSM 2912 / NBRC 15312 / T2) TaxID=562970 RepID=D5WSM5_KYRT2|nr:PASTA domain-containing protein [Kyrpidia tusciae]ADG07044.1 PASTA domain containing protein [Kyrpidia tusciae DSM 2912]